MPKKISAGILLCRHNEKTKSMEFLLVHPGGPYFTNKDLGFWSIPKGEINPNEDYLKCALREFEEETGNTVSGEVIELGNITQKNNKDVYAWAYQGTLDRPFKSNSFSMEWPPHSGKTQEFPEVDRAEFFDSETAKQKILPEQAEFIDRALQKFNQKV